ncbi:MAG: helix-turn-helix domain-containing protein, partial [Chthonomonadales bacterium]|nr:helix-turn-helix domain-containing protein [Chthonomonadales bacterium]
MSVHRNAALSLVKRRELVDFVAAGATLKAAAAAFNVGGNTVRRWWRRY